MTDDPTARLERLLGYFEQDRDNLALATDCADAALAADRPAQADAILAPFAAADTLDDRARNLAGIAAMRAGDQARAQAHFTRLLERDPTDRALQFNLAWSLALAGEHGAARIVLGDVAADDPPQVALLDLQLDHQRGDLAAAGEKLEAYCDRFPDYAPLRATAAMLAMDLDRPDLARLHAERGGAHPDALAALGILDLGDDRLDDARELFRRSLATREVNPRANLGFGLAELAAGNAQSALPYLDRGAEQFGDHLGSWIAAGWAYFLAGDATTARARFETALAADDTFGEAQGSLAAMDAFAGNFDEARRRMTIAQRLDRDSFSAGLTATVLAAADGEPDKARRMFDILLRQPITHDGRTLAEVLARTTL